MRVLYLADRMSVRGGADLHLRQVMEWAVSSGYDVTMACGHVEKGVEPPPGVTVSRIRGLASAVTSTRRLGGLAGLLADAEVVHVQNVMNPEVLRLAAGTGRAVVTVQDHRFFCPGMGKTLPDGRLCDQIMAAGPCSECLEDPDYRSRLIRLTRERRDALAGCAIVVLSRWMAERLAEVGLGGAHVIPPWFEPGPAAERTRTGVLMAGRLVPHKGVEDGWRAWLASGCGDPLLVAGDGPLHSRLEGAELLGWLSAADLRRTMRSVRVLLLPSYWQEPFGMVGVEALAESTPVIVAVSGGVTEWASAGSLRVPLGDVDAMAAAINRIFDEPGLADRLGREGRSMVTERFSRQAAEARIRDLYGVTAERHDIACAQPASYSELVIREEDSR